MASLVRGTQLRGYSPLTQFKHSEGFMWDQKALGNEVTISQTSLVIFHFFTLMKSFISISQTAHCSILKVSNTIILSVLYFHGRGGLCGLDLHIFTFSIDVSSEPCRTSPMITSYVCAMFHLLAIESSYIFIETLWYVWWNCCYLDLIWM